MWDVEKVKIQNFLAISKAELKLANQGVILVEGDNQDDSSANSNGAGKSSLMDSVCWCLYGITGRGVSGDAVINKIAKKDCEVEVVLSVDDRRLVVKRGRKSKKLENGLVVQIQEGGNPVSDLTKTTVAETQKALEALLGCNYEIFSSSIYSAQEKMPDLPAMTDKTLKVLIEESAGIDRLQKASEIANVILRNAENEKNKIEADIKSHENAKNSLENLLKNYDEQEKAYFEEIRGKCANLAREIAQTKNDKVSDLKAKDILPVTKIEELKKKSTELKSYLDNYSTYEEAVKKQELEVGSKKGALIAEKANLERDKAEIKGFETELANVESKVGTKCKECGKVYQPEDLEEAKSSIRKKIMNKRGEFAVKVKNFKTECEALKGLQEKAVQERKKLPDISSVSAQANEINAMITASSFAEERLKSYDRKIESLEKELKENEKKLKADTPYTSLRKDAEADLTGKKCVLSYLNDRLKESKEKVERDVAVSQLFGVKGVRAHILDTITPFLNERTAFYLNTLSDGEITATWQTLTKNAKGEYKEKFSINVKSIHGATSFAGLSGGEKRKVRVATSMALQDLVASRSKCPIALYVADEVDHALDASGLERLMTLLTVKAKQYKSVVVISHNSLRDWIDNVVTVVKKDGQSTIWGEE